jgi:hypothetical protein
MSFVAEELEEVTFQRRQLYDLHNMKDDQQWRDDCDALINSGYSLPRHSRLNNPASYKLKEIKSIDDLALPRYNIISDQGMYVSHYFTNGKYLTYTGGEIPYSVYRAVLAVGGFNSLSSLEYDIIQKNIDRLPASFHLNLPGELYIKE